MLTYNVLFYETFWYKKYIDKHPLTIHAFGIDTEIMKPKPKINQIYNYLTIGEPASYKRHELFLSKNGKKAIIGDFSQYEKQVAENYKKNDCVIINFIPYKLLADYYCKAKIVFIPANTGGGGERAILEARSCGAKIEICEDNPKLKELVYSPIWSHYYYANKLDKGIKKVFNIKIPDNEILCSNRIMAGIDSFHNGNFIIKGDENVSIGSYCAIGENVKIITSNHDYNFPAIQGTLYHKAFNKSHPGESQKPPNKERTKGDVVIGNDVWIGDDVTILSGVSIGDGACIASKSLISRDVEPYSIVGGVPAKILKYRYNAMTIEKLLRHKWWNKSFDEIKNSKDFFFTNLNNNSSES